jgi:hypothetical protein
VTRYDRSFLLSSYVGAGCERGTEIYMTGSTTGKNLYPDYMSTSRSGSAIPASPLPTCFAIAVTAER